MGVRRIREGVQSQRPLERRWLAVGAMSAQGELLDATTEAEVGASVWDDCMHELTALADREGREITEGEAAELARLRNDAERLACAAVVLWHDAGRPEDIRDRIEALPNASVFIAAQRSDPATEQAFAKLTETEPKPGPPVLPDHFWQARPVLEQIRQAARSRLAGPDAVLGNALARVAAITPFTVKLPATVGSHAGLTFYVATVQMSGMGKSVGQAVARDVIPAPPEVLDVPAGSGEGLVETMFDLVEEETADGKTTKVKRQVRYGLIVTIDEGTQVFEIGQRQGATLHSTIRTAFSGGVLGNTNASIERRRIVPAGRYVLGVSLGVQPEKAGPLLADVEAGTPQRFLWMAAGDPSVPDQTPTWPEDLTWSPPSTGDLEPYKEVIGSHVRHVMDVAPSIREEISDQRKQVLAGTLELDPMEAHTMLVRLKTAALLAIIDRRLDVTDEDWRLAGIVVDTSSAVRSHVQSALARADAQRETARTRQIIRREAASEGAARDRALASASKSVARKVRKLGRAKRRDLTLTIAGKHRKLVTVDEVLIRAEADGLIEVDGNEWIPGRREP